eukprot:3770854-Amphidinium_carterae.1
MLLQSASSNVTRGTCTLSNLRAQEARSSFETSHRLKSLACVSQQLLTAGLRLFEAAVHGEQVYLINFGQNAQYPLLCFQRLKCSWPPVCSHSLAVCVAAFTKSTASCSEPVSYTHLRAHETEADL